jgi:diaminopimelate decarboxylase
MTSLNAIDFAGIANHTGTPVYVYDRERIEHNYRRLDHAFCDARSVDHTTPSPGIRYSVKANSNLTVLHVLHNLGSGFDVVSGGELQRVLRVGADAAGIVFAGVGKRDDELAAALDECVAWINVESAQELRVLSDLAGGRGVRQRVALRINPGIDPHTHRYMDTGRRTSKFGIEMDEALHLAAMAADFRGVAIEGIHIHIGSMVSDVQPYVDAMHIGLEIAGRCRELGLAITTLDLGGGFAVAYQPDQPASPIETIAQAIVPMAERAGLALLFEPGRAIIADAGVLLARVLFTKTNGGVNYAIVDAAMNDLIRPALYGARHAVTRIASERGRSRTFPADQSRLSLAYSIAGPICESGDRLADEVWLPELHRGDLLAFHHCGAYGMSMASNYNARARAAEVLADGERGWRLIRPREEIRDLMAGEAALLD